MRTSRSGLEKLGEAAGQEGVVADVERCSCCERMASIDKERWDQYLQRLHHGPRCRLDEVSREVLRPQDGLEPKEVDAESANGEDVRWGNASAIGLGGAWRRCNKREPGGTRHSS